MGNTNHGPAEQIQSSIKAPAKPQINTMEGLKQALNSLKFPAQLGNFSQLRKMQRPFNVDRKSVSVSHLGGSRYGLSFEMQARVPVFLKANFFAKELWQGRNLDYGRNDPNLPAPVCFKIEPAQKFKFPNDLVTLDIDEFPNSLQAASVETHHLILELRSRGTNDVYAAEVTYLQFDISTGTVEVTSQQVCIGTKVFTLTDSLQPDDYCVICKTNPPDCMLDPCKHFCFCTDCAEEASRYQKIICPLCRADVKRFIKTCNACQIIL